MTLEERIVNEVREELAAVPARRAGPVPAVSPRRRRWVAVAASLVVVVGVGLTVGGLAGRGSDVVAGPNEVVLAGQLVVPVTGNEVTVGGVSMDVAAPAPALDDDVEIPGTEVVLDRSGPPGEAHLPNDTDGPMIYVGTVAGQAVVLHDDDPPIGGVGEELASLLRRVTDGPVFCANTDGCSHPGDGPQMGFGHSRSGLGPFFVNATGFALPSETAAVSITTGDGARYWQRPAGNTVTVKWEQANAPRPPFRFVGYDSSGEEIFREIFR